MVLPLTELQSEIRGLTGRNILKQQLSTGKINTPSVSSTLKDSGLVTFDITEDETNLTPKARKSGKMADSHNEKNEESANCREGLAGNDHELPRGIEDTWF